jgi:hypothetical protein
MTLQLAVAQGQQAKQEGFNRLLAVFGTMVLIPGLVAAVYGANVALPGRDGTRGLGSMLCLMVAFGAGSWSCVSAFSGHGGFARRSARLAAAIGVLSVVIALLFMFGALGADGPTTRR